MEIASKPKPNSRSSTRPRSPLHPDQPGGSGLAGSADVASPSGFDIACSGVHSIPKCDMPRISAAGGSISKCQVARLNAAAWRIVTSKIVSLSPCNGASSLGQDWSPSPHLRMGHDVRQKSSFQARRTGRGRRVERSSDGASLLTADEQDILPLSFTPSARQRVSLVKIISMPCFASI